MASRPLTPERAIRRPWRVDLRAVLSVLVTVVAIGGMLMYAGSLSDTRPLLVAVRDLPAGATLTRDDLSVAQVRVDDAIYVAAVPADRLGAIVGKELAEPVHSQQILVRAQVSDRPRLAPDQLALTIPVKAESAAGGRLRAGDEVRVFVTRDKNTPEPDTTVVLERVRIYGVDYDERAVVTGSTVGGPAEMGPLASVTLIVTGEGARVLAAARHGGELDVALLPPLPTPRPVSPVDGDTGPAPAGTPASANPTTSGKSR